MLTSPHQPLSDLILEIFRVNGLLLAWGNGLTSGHGLSSSLWQVLGAVSKEPMTLAGIARFMGLTRQSVRRSAQLLEKRGLVAFEPNPEHKRAHLVRMTDQGQEALARISADYHQATEAVAQSLGPKDADHARALLHKLGNLFESLE